MIKCHEDDDSINEDEIVLRRIPFVVFDENIQALRPSTQSFKQGGRDGLVSVYLDSETTPARVMSEGPEKFLACLRVSLLRELDLGVIRDPASGGPGHCVITGRKTKGKLNRIVQGAEWIEDYRPTS